VAADRVLADHQPVRDLAIGQTRGEVREHLALSGGEPSRGGGVGSGRGPGGAPAVAQVGEPIQVGRCAQGAQRRPGVVQLLWRKLFPKGCAGIGQVVVGCIL
jgi:hypothetical protein